MVFQPSNELLALGSFGEVVSWAVGAWAPPDGPRSVREMADVGLVRESNTVATGGADVAVNNHAMWYVLLGWSGAADFHDLDERRDQSWESAERGPPRNPPVVRRCGRGAGEGRPPGPRARAAGGGGGVGAWGRDRRRALARRAVSLRPAAVVAAVEATRDLVRDHRLLDGWLAQLQSALTVPALWQPSSAQDVPRLSLPRLDRHPLTLVTGEMGSGKSRYIRQQLAGYVRDARAAGPVRRVVPLVLGAEQLPTVMAQHDPWAGAVRAFVADHSASIGVQEQDRLAELLVARSRSGDLDVVIACDGLDELPHATLLRLLDQASGLVARFLRAEHAGVVVGVRSGIDAERVVRPFADGVIGGAGELVKVGALTRWELAELARAWRVPLSPHRLDEFLDRHPTALLATCGLTAGDTEHNDSDLLKLGSLLAVEWYVRAIAESSQPRLAEVDVDAGTALEFMRCLVWKWAARTDAESSSGLAAAMYDAWRRWGETLTQQAADEVRRALASHAASIGAALTDMTS